MVFRNDTRTVGSCAKEAKLANPTNCGAETMSQRKKARTSEAMIGRKVKRVIPITVGARKILASHRSTKDRRTAGGFTVDRGTVDVVVINSSSGPVRGHVEGCPSLSVHRRSCR